MPVIPMKILTVFLLLLLALPAAASETTPAQPGATGLPLPRFVSTRSDSVNVRTGPGERYPVQWVLRKKGMPVEITAEYENWRKVRDWEGTEGWVHMALLSGRRNAVIYPGDGVLRSRPDAIARPLARLQQGVMARIKECRADWCEISVGSTPAATAGWVNKSSLWGVYPSETIE